MKHCSLCGVDVDTSREFCPLCHNDMEDVSEKTEPENFPVYSSEKPQTKSAKAFIIKVFLVLSVLIIASCVFINIETKTIPWSVTVSFVIVYLWVLVAHTIISKSSAFDKVFFELSSICAFLVSINLVFSSTKWFTYYVYPSLAMLATIVLTIMLFIVKNKKNWIFSFFCIYLLEMVVSAIFLIFKIDDFMTLNIINLIFQGVVVFAYLLFDGKRIIAELIRKFHI